MRNLKKILAAITVIAMLASMMVVPALASGFKYEAEAEILNELKLMEGMGLGDSANRLQGLIFAIKAAGLADEVNAMTDEEAAAILAEKVVDADQVPDWGRKWTAYAVENGYTSGTDASTLPKVTFSPLQEVSGTSFMVWIMNIGMGYNVGTDVVVAKAVEANVITLSQAMEFGTKAALIRDDVAGILYGACKNGVNADGKAFIQSLIDADFITEADAVAAGFVEAKPEALEVVGVSATNLKQLVVEFNIPIKKAGDNNNYSLETEGNALIDDKSGFDLKDDKKTVVITLTDQNDEAADQQEVVALTIKDIESESGLKLKETTIEDIEMFDNTIPKAVSAEVVGKYTIKVTFSEPILTAEDDLIDCFSIDDGDYIIEKVEKVNRNTELNVSVYSALDEGTVTIECKNGIQDYAGYGIPKKTFDVSVATDETAPEVVGYKDAKPTGVTLIFDEDINVLKTNSGDNVYFYHTNKNNPAKDVKAEGKELKISFDENVKMSEGPTRIYIEKEVIEDLWENKNAKISYTIEVSIDTTKPTLEKVEQGDGQQEVKLTFSEELHGESAESSDNYTILDKDGKVVDVNFTVDLDKDDAKVVILTISGDDKLAGDYSIVVEKVEDLAGNAISKTTKAFKVKDSEAPDFAYFTAKLYNEGEKGQMIRIDFGEAMAVSGTYSVIDLEKYSVNNINLADYKDASIKAVDGNKAVEIKVPYEGKDKQYVFAAGDTVGDTVIIARVADASGNKTDAFSSPVSGAGAIKLAEKGDVEIEKVEMTAKDTFVVTLKDRLTKFKATDFFKKGDDEDDSFITIGDTAQKISRIKHTLNDKGKSVITLTLADKLDSTALPVGIAFKPINTESTNAYGEALDDAAVEADNIKDKAAPIVEEIYFDDKGNDDSDDDIIVVEFSEPIDGDTVLGADGSKNGFSVAGGKAKLTSALQDTDPTKFILTGEDLTKYTDVSYTEYALADDAGNKVASFKRTDALKVIKELEGP